MQETENKNIGVFVVLNIILVFLVGILIFSIFSFSKESKKKSLGLIPNKHSFEIDEKEILAKSVIVFDILNNKVLYEKNSDNILPLASLTKIVTGLTAKKLMPDDTIVSIKKEFLNEEGDNGLLVGEKWNIKNLIDYSLIVSSNDAFRSIASVVGADFFQKDIDIGRELFIKKMNETVLDLGLTTMKFENETGLDYENKIGGLSSARDFSKLVSYIISNYPDLLESTKNLEKNISSKNFVHKAVNTNEIVNKIPNIIASKTGFTDKAGGNLLVVFDAGVNRPISIIVLGSTINGRFEDVLKLASSTIYALD
jgi:D-alanyl-D-alanine carboxypeptidase